MNTIEFEDIDRRFIIQNNNLAIKVIKDGIDFYFKLALKDEFKPIVIFSNGAYNSSRVTPPIFMRNSWHKEYEFSAIFIDDRTCHDKSLRIGWGVGYKERHYLIDYYEVISKICEIIGKHSEEVYYYGSSAGGFMSIYLATLHKGSTAIVNNPQTYVTKYNKIAVDRLFRAAFPDMSDETIKKKYANRFSLVSAMKRFDNTPRIYYIQNARCKGDMEKHCNPFMMALIKYKIPSQKIQFIFYNNDKMGHDPISKEDTIRMIHSVIKGYMQLNV
ncbi:alpha/beta hydrolase [Macrococcoides goetzii]|nr:alpha/beta hydrolase [Macrococcus goetzii]TDM50802.1 alpha/beta hydrolase [Macrococcus goetzii]